jgi:hypothetical protein
MIVSGLLAGTPFYFIAASALVIMSIESFTRGKLRRHLSCFNLSGNWGDIFTRAVPAGLRVRRHAARGLR